MKKVFEKRYDELIRQINRYIPGNGDLPLLERAYWYGFEAHKGQFRRSGAPYFEHCVATANILSELHLDITTIAAGLLHDVVEDTGISINEVEQEFGSDIAMLVDGVTKIADLRFKQAEIKQSENFRKMLISMAKDIRVIMIKFADRLHNMRTLEHLPVKKQNWIAHETLDVYAPLAHRFGIARLAWQLEDLALKFIDSEAYKFIDNTITEKWSDRMKHIEKMKDPIRREMSRLNIPCSISGRPKSYYSIYRKMQARNIPFDEIYDLLAMRVITEKKEDCYLAVGVIHNLFTPVADRFKDFIATPKSNGYQSIHTTVIIPDGHTMEVQIRTKLMDQTAEVGIAAHWAYKAKYSGEDLDEQMGWFHRFLDSDMEGFDSTEFMQSFKFDLVQDEVFVFTPRGKLIKLPRDATPVDFSFAVHSEIGLHCIGAKVNSKVVPLSTSLQNGDEVEILTSSEPKPQEYWLSFVVTSRASDQIKKWFRINRRSQYREIAREMLENELAKHGEADTDLNDNLLGQRSGFSNLNILYESLVQHSITPTEIIRRVYPSLYKKSRRSIFGRLPRIWKGSSKDEPIILIHGDNPLVIELSTCCMPIPGDKIVGYYDENKGVVVHRAKCKEAPDRSADGKRAVHVEWADTIEERVFPVSITVTGGDRKHMLRDIAVEISSLDINVLGIHIEVKDAVAEAIITLEVKNIKQLDTVKQRLSRIKSVQRVIR